MHLLFWAIAIVLLLLVDKDIARPLRDKSLKGALVYNGGQSIEEHAEMTLAGFPPSETVINTILVFTSGPCRVHFQDAFCGGDNFTVYDNNVFIVTVPGSVPRLCGINTSSYEPIISPLFASYDLFITAGFHNITAVIMGSPLGNGSAALRITFFPLPTTKITIISSSTRAIKSS